MGRLLWKEFRERRLWAIPLVLSVVGVVAAGMRYTFCGNVLYLVRWAIPSALVALLVGMGAYSSEIAWGTPDFLFSRSISWKRVMLAKVLFALGLIVSSAVLGAIVYRIVCPEPYVKFATLAGLARGVGIALLIMVSGYLAGAISSVLFPGYIGAILTFVSLGIVLSGALALITEFFDYQGLPNRIVPAWWLAALIACLVVLRFGMTLTIEARARRFVLVFAGFAILFMVGCFLFPRQMLVYMPPRTQILTISPDGRYAVATERGDWRVRDGYRAAPVRLYMVDLSSGAKASVSSSHDGIAVIDGGQVLVYSPFAWEHLGAREVRWSPNGTVYFVSQDYTTRFVRHCLITLRLDAKRKVILRRIPLQTTGGDNPVPSPDGRLAAVFQWEKDSRVGSVQVLDIDRGRSLGAVTDRVGWPVREGVYLGSAWWWQSNTEIGYMDKHDNRRIVRVVE